MNNIITFASLGQLFHHITALNKKVCLVFENEDDVLQMSELLPSAAVFPAWELLPFEPLYGDQSRTSRRFATLAEITAKTAQIIITTDGALLQKLPPQSLSARYTLQFKKGMHCDLTAISKALTKAGFTRVYETQYPGQFSVRGDILDIFVVGDELPHRILFFDDEIEEIRIFNPGTQLSTSGVDSCTVYPLKETIFDDHVNVTRLQEMNRPVLQLVNTGRYEGFEKDYPYLYDEYSSILDYCNDDYEIWVIGEESVNSRFFSRLDTTGRLEHENDTIRDFYHDTVNDSRFLRFRLDEKSDTQERIHGFSNSAQFFQALSLWNAEQYNVTMYFNNTSQAELFKEHYPEVVSAIRVEIGVFTGSYKDIAYKSIVLSHDEMLGRYANKSNTDYSKKRAEPVFISDLNEGDYIVHIDYGIGVYRGVVNDVIAGKSGDYIIVEYAGNNRIFVPVEHMEKIEKYIGDQRHVKVSSMGDSLWRRTKATVKDKVRSFAVDLLRLQAERASIQGYSFAADSHDQQLFEDAFIYTETDDQHTAAEEIKRNMESEKVMERLLCGDVGFGKTEVAMRAAFKAVENGKQVAVLCPTTVLAIQHYATFRERMADFPVSIAMLSRLVAPKDVKDIKKRIESHEIDIVIGTHKMLSATIQYKDLGLLIIDEEQRFGVYHKETLKERSKTVDTLILTATPIPRTLYMSLVGVIHLSRLETPPANRHPVQTRAIAFDDDLLREIIFREHRRQGQVFIIHNRIKDIESIRERIDRIADNRLKSDYVHGQMHAHEIEKKLLSFIRKETDILISTTIIENGIDIPNVNTIIINEADMFGLSQLYQLRGRVGRRETQAYAYLILPPRVSSLAMERINALLNYDHLGAGFEIAMRDLELRGAGNIIGKEQSGYMNMVGYDLYVKLLKEAVAEITETPLEERAFPQLDIQVTAFIPDSFVADGAKKIGLYKKIYAARDNEMLQIIRREMKDRFGGIPVETEALFEIAQLRLIAEECGVTGIEEGKGILSVYFSKDIGINTILALIENYGDKLSFNSTGEFKAVLKINNEIVLEQTKEFLSLLHGMLY